MSAPSAKVVYTPAYNIGFFGIERLHPFDSRKYGRAWRELRRHFGRALDDWWVKPERLPTREQLLRVHTPDYIDKTLRDPRSLARGIEIPPLRYAPAWLTDLCVLRPMRWATAGTIRAAHLAMEHGIAVNLSGGYHHASAGIGEGFSIYNDIAVAIADLRHSGLLDEGDRVAYIDLDAHQGNGVERVFMNDSRVFIFDMYNAEIYPRDEYAASRIDRILPLPDGCIDNEYLGTLTRELPPFIENLYDSGMLKLAIYNAGTDILKGDLLGDLSVSRDGVLQRDQFVTELLTETGLPWVMLPSGGYTSQSYELLSTSTATILERWGN